MEEKDFDNLEDKIAEAKKEAESKMTGEDKAKALVDAAKQPENMVRLAVSNKVSNKIATDEDTKQRISDTADKLVNSSVTTIENEADAHQNKSEADKLKTYFEAHKEELKTAGIDAYTYIEDMERAVKCHRKWCNVHWYMFGWWMTGIRTIIMKAKPFKTILNILAIMLGLAAGTGIVLLLIKLFSLF